MFTTECPLSGGIASTVGLHPSKLVYKKHIFVMLTTPKIISVIQNTAAGGSFLGFAKPLCRNSEISHGFTLWDSNSCRLFQTQSKSMPRCIGDKNVLAAFGRTSGAISVKSFCVNVHCGPTFIFQVSCKFVQVWGVITENCSMAPK